MGIRRTAAQLVRRLAGPGGLERVKGVDRTMRRAAINALDVEARTSKHRTGPTQPPNKPAKPKLDPETRRLRRIEELGRRDLADAVNQEDLKWATPDPFTPHPKPPMTRHQLLSGLHEVLQPRTYLEVGVRYGGSLTLSRARTIGVDPAYMIKKPLHCDLQTFVETSDEFFARPDAFAHFDGVGIDLAFLDGMHMAEYTLRDFIATEAHAAPGGIVVLDDVLPRNDLEAYRLRRTGPWSGDIYKVIGVLQKYRPDLVVLPLNTAPTGTLLIAGLDPSNTVLAEAYEEIEPALTQPDPQSVPLELQNRSVAVNPLDVLSSDVFARAVALRGAGGDVAAFATLYAELDAMPRYGAISPM